jgi:hypothetical protein
MARSSRIGGGGGAYGVGTDPGIHHRDRLKPANISIIPARRPDRWRAHRLGHAVEHHLARAERGLRFVNSLDVSLAPSVTLSGGGAREVHHQ